MQAHKKYDLEERTGRFGEDVIIFAKGIPENAVTKRIIAQLVGAATSVGANYCEADCSESSRDFVHKMSIANKEAKESKHFLRMIAVAFEENADQGQKLLKEATELNLIFTTIIKKVKEKL